MPLSIVGNFLNSFYSAYRPIIFKVQDTASDTAYIRGELFMETLHNSGTFVSTGVLVNGYADATDPDIFSFNLMEYVRHYVSKGILPPLHYVFPGHLGEIATFKLTVWSVKYSSQAVGQLYDDFGNSQTSRKFTATGLVTSEADSMDTQDFYINMNRYVLGANSNWGLVVDSHLPWTNAPNSYPITSTFPIPVKKDYFGSQTINIDDAPTDSLYFPVAFDNTYTRLVIMMIDMPITGTASLNQWEVFPGGDTLWKQPLHPESIEYQYFLSTGSVLSKLVTGAGALKASAMAILPVLANNNFSSYKMLHNTTENSPWFWYNYSNEEDNGHCTRGMSEGQGGEGSTRTKFMFKNMRGGYDFFNCYGTHTKEIVSGGTMFDNHKMWANRALHSRKSLWTTREDVYSVITQPLPTEHATWLEQLLTSPQVWVQKVVKEAESTYNKDVRFFSINIDKESYTVHNSEDNVNYISFKYKLSEPISTQKG